MNLVVIVGPNARRIWAACFVCASAVTLAVALMPASRAPQGVGWDKMNHLLAFLMLGVNGMLAFGHWRRGGLIVLLLLAGLGALIEIGQSLVPSRKAEAMDLVADMIGAGLGVAIGWAFLALLLRSGSRNSR